MKKPKKPIKMTKKRIKLLERRIRNKSDKNWSKDVKLRDNNKCAVCGSTSFLHTHHIIPREFKESRHDVNNGITLCANHHKYSLEISSHRNSMIFALWLIKNKESQIKGIKSLQDYIKNNPRTFAALLKTKQDMNNWVPFKSDSSGHLFCVKCGNEVEELDDLDFCQKCVYSELDDSREERNNTHSPHKPEIAGSTPATVIDNQLNEPKEAES